MTNEGPVGAHAVLGGEAGPSDLELVQRTREGDSRAFGELWNRHSRAGRTVARSYALDPDDVVAESFAKVLQAIKGGGGPTAAFRPYLFSTIRNVAMQWRKASIVDASDELDALADPSSEDSETLLALDKSLTALAFRSLPTRWQEALWYSEVEQLSSHEISPLLGMTPNAVSALTFRAREGLRQAWIQAHLVRSADTECAAIIEKLGSYTRGALGPRESKRVETHLAGCPSCTIVEEEAHDIGSRLALVMLPLAAGIAGALAYTVWLQGGSSASAATLSAAASVTAPGAGGPTPVHAPGGAIHAPSGAASHAGSLGGAAGHAGSAGGTAGTGAAAGGTPKATAPGAEPSSGDGAPLHVGGHPAHATTPLAPTPAEIVSIMPSPGVLAGIGLAVAAAIAAAFVLGPLASHTPSTSMSDAAAPSSAGEQLFGANDLFEAPSRGAAARAAAAAAAQAAANGAGTGSSASSTLEGESTSDSAAGSTTTSGPGGATAGGGTGGSTGGTPASSTAGGEHSTSGNTAGGATGDPAAPPTAAQTDTPEPPESPAPTPPPSTTQPTPPPTSPPPTAPPTSPPTTPPSTPPTADPPAAPEARFTLDPNDRLYPILAGTAEPGATVEVVDQTAVGAEVVAQTVADGSGSFGLRDFPQLGFGSHRLAVRQLSAAGVASTAAASTPVVLDDITFVAPTAGSTLTGLSYLVAATGDPTAFFDILLDGVGAATGLRLNADGNASADLDLPAQTEPGELTLSLRYVDPSAGRFGPTKSITVVYEPAG